MPGSPFKVSVMSTADAAKVVCSGDGLTSIVQGAEGSVLIDARAAGPGLYSACGTLTMVLRKLTQLVSGLMNQDNVSVLW